MLTLTGCRQAIVAPAAPLTTAATLTPASQELPAVAQFRKVIEPILRERCYDCHGDGSSKGGIAFDELTAVQIAHDPQFWLKVLKNTRSHVMPPLKTNNPLTEEERVVLESWITTSGFGLDPRRPDPGRVTLHRLNRVEYKNTIRDLLGVEFETHSAFPDDDSGYGFDNIADVLNMSPLLMEKYLAAAQTIIDQTVPKVSRQPAVAIADVGDFKFPDGTPTVGKSIKGSGLGNTGIPAIPLPYSKETSISHVFDVKEPGAYRLVIEDNIRGDFFVSPQRMELTVTFDDRQLLQKEYGWQMNLDQEQVYNLRCEPGRHTLTFAVKPVAPGRAQDIVYNIRKVRLEGPLDEARWVPPPNYARFFPRDVPADTADRRTYARELIEAFATKAFRRPATTESVEPLVDIAEKFYTAPGGAFEAAIAQAMVAVLASPRFLYRVESPAPAAPNAAVANIDEHSLASRLSYFLWSTMPDEELLKLAAAGRLRVNLGVQVKRMLADPRSANFIEHFPGQWLQSRLVTTVPLNQREILRREGVNPPSGGRGGFGGGGANVSDALRNAFKAETEKYFEHVLRENRSVDEFLTSDYTFLNETAAAAYKIEDVKGPEMRKVTLPPDDARGGILTMGSVLMITSNPTRTSPVKRGKWILDNILDAPAPPPPPDIPALEEVKAQDSARVPTLRETLAVHRENVLCASCHNRMDPLGLALENFNALGSWRTQEYGQKIDASGKLATGETFADIRDLKRILAANHKVEFYRCLTEKLLTYALGRGTEYYDVPAVDEIVANLEKNHGAFLALLMGVIESVPFQQQRLFNSPAAQPAPRLAQTAP